MKTPRGIIFDFDGVLVDTEWAIYQSWVWLYQHEGQELSIRTYSPCLGAGYSRWDPAAHLEKLTGRTYNWEAINPVRQARIHADLTRMGLMDGARALFEWCAANKVAMAVASSSSLQWVAGWLERLGVYGLFKGVFCRTDGYAVKPDPALFLAAHQCLGLPKEDCLIIEDSENGILAAHNAGIPSVAIPCRMTEEGDFSLATYREQSLISLLQKLEA